MKPMIRMMVFSNHVLTALENCKDAARLGEHAHLASPCFLGKYLLQPPKKGAEYYGFAHEAEATRKIWDDSDCSAEK